RDLDGALAGQALQVGSAVVEDGRRRRDRHLEISDLLEDHEPLVAVVFQLFDPQHRVATHRARQLKPLAVHVVAHHALHQAIPAEKADDVPYMYLHGSLSPWRTPP